MAFEDIFPLLAMEQDEADYKRKLDFAVNEICNCDFPNDPVAQVDAIRRAGLSPHSLSYSDIKYIESEVNRKYG